MVSQRRWLMKDAIWVLSLILATSTIHAQVTTTTVQGVVYRADGTAATGTLIVNWPAFSTANNQAIAGGSATAAIGQDGFVSLNLAPNAGSSPAGSYYTAIYHLTDGTVNKEYWVVPATASASIVAVRAQLVPATVAVQDATKQYVDASIASIGGNYLPLTGGSMTGPLLLSGGPLANNQAATKQYTDQAVATAVPLAGGNMTGTLRTPNTVTKLPRVDVRHPDFAGGADPTGTSDSTAAIQAAIAYAVANPLAGSNGAIPCVYIPAGLYVVSSTLRIPSNLCVEGDSSQASVLQLTSSQTNLFTVYAGTCAANERCNGQISDLQLYGNGHASTGTLLEVDGAVQFHIANVTMANHGGRGLQLNNNSERFRSDNLSISSVRWPVILAGDINESYFFNTQIISPGSTAERYGEEYYCYGVNCPSHSYPYPNQGLSGGPTPVSPDPHGAITIVKAVNYSFYGGSIKSLKYMSGFRASGYGSIRNFYLEGFPYSNEPRLNAGIYVNGGVLEKTQLSGELPAAGLIVGVSDASWLPQYFELASDVGNNSYVAYAIMPQDFLSGSTAPSQYDSNIQRGQFELVQVAGFSSDGNMHIVARNLSGSTYSGDWPAGSMIEEAPVEPHGAIDIQDSHIEAIQPPGAGYADNCNQTGVLTCAEIVTGQVPDGFIVDPPGGALEGIDGYTSALVTMKNLDMAAQSYPHSGEIVVHRYSSLNFDGVYGLPGQFETAETVGTSSKLQLASITGGSYLTVPAYSNRESAQPTVMVPGAGIVWVPSNGLFTKYEQQFAQYGGYNQWMAGTKFANSYCWFDTPTVGSTQSLNRICFKGSPGSTSQAGYEYDVWNGTKWAVAFSVTGESNSTANVSISGAARTGGAFTAASVNGEITVDGITYPTLNMAWSAALSLAATTGHNQTVRLGPGTYTVAATLTEPTNGACVNLVGSGGASTAADSTASATTLTVNSNLGGDVIFLGNTAQAQGCVFKDFTVLANNNATHAFELQWFRGLLVDSVTVNDTSAEGILLGEESTTNGHQAGFLLRNITVSYSASVFSPASRPAYGIHLQQTAMDSHLDTVLVRNALIAGVYNEGTGNTGYMIHGFGYPYTCTTAPCSNAAASASAANASYATNYVIYDTGGAGNVWTDTYADSPAVAAFYIGANGITVHGGHVQWPDLTSFPSANLAYVSSSVTNGMEIADIGCLGMSPSVNWITYASASGVPPTFASVHHLTGCGNYAQSLEPETTTGFTGGGASNNAPGNSAVATIWASPKAGTSNYEAYSAQLYNGYQTDIFEGHIAGQSPFFNVTYQGTIRTDGGIALSTILNTASALTLTAANKNVIADAASGAQNITLPSCYTAWPDKATPTGEEFTIIKSDTSANAVTLTTTSSQAINYQGTASASLVISSAGKRTLVCGPDANWYAY